MNRIWTVARREVKALFDNPAGYVLLVVFLVVNGFLLFRQLYLTSSATLRPMLDTLPWLLLFFVPAVGMRALAEDARGGQLEVVLSQPLTELELLLGKYLGVVLFLWTALLFTLAIPLGLSLGAELPWGPVVAQYVGAMLLAAGLAGVAVWASGMARSQMTAFILAVAVMFLLVLVGLNPLIVGLPANLGVIAARLGVLSHFDSIGRGVIDLRDAVYFVSLAAVFLTLAYAGLMGRKLAPGSGSLRRLRLGTLLLAGTLVVANLLGSYIGGRLDLTPGRAYTLAPATRDLVRGLDDIVTIKLFASDELPAEVALMKRDLDDILGDLRTAGHGKVKIVERDPATDPAAKRDADAAGVAAVQFNVVGQQSLQVKEGYLGIAVQYADGVEGIPFVRRTDDLEYRLASAIRGLTRRHKPRLGLVVAMDDWGQEGRNFQMVQTELAKSYEVRPLSLGDTALALDSVAALIIAGQPDSLLPPVRARLERYFAEGGSALIMASGAPIVGREPKAAGKEPLWNVFLKPFGLKIRPDLAYDLSSNQIVPVPSQSGGQVFQPYPFWVRALAAGGSVVTEGIGEIFLPWASTIDTTGARPGSVTPLLMTSRAGSIAEGDIDLTPTRIFPPVDLRPRVLGAMSAPAAGDSTGPTGRVVVVGNMEFATDRYASNNQENAIFALNAIDWLAQDPALITIRSRDRQPPRLLFSSPALQEGVKYANVIMLPLLVAGWGAFRLIRRRRRSLEPWRPLAGGGAEAT